MPATKIDSRWSSGDLLFRNASAVEIARFSNVAGFVRKTGQVINVRTRFTVAQINAGATLVAAVAGYTLRMIECSMIAIGGAASAVTTIDVKGVQAASGVVLVAFAQASLTQSTELRAGDSGSTILADGASHVANDANTAITVIKAGSDVATATSIDVILTYALEAA